MVPAAADVADTASGVLAVEVGRRPRRLPRLVPPRDAARGHLGRRPVQPEDWSRTAAGPRLSPRRSFDRVERGGARHRASRGATHEVDRRAGARAAASARPGSAASRRTTGWPPRCSARCCSRAARRPRVALAARYLPSAQDVVGGDWYDLVPLPSGRVAVVLGDVAGHGLTAAAITAQLRHALRAHCCAAGARPRRCAALNELVARLLPDELATAVSCEVDPGTGEVVVATPGTCRCCARPPGARPCSNGRGPALGCSTTPQYPRPGLTPTGEDRLLLYSDGLVERGAAPASRTGSAPALCGRGRGTVTADPGRRRASVRSTRRTPTTSPWSPWVSRRPRPAPTASAVTCALSPAVAAKEVPDTIRAASEARNTTSGATSAGSIHGRGPRMVASDSRAVSSSRPTSPVGSPPLDAMACA